MALNSLAQRTGRSLTYLLLILSICVVAAAKGEPPHRRTFATAASASGLTLNLSDFDPAADGVTDDGPAFQQAFDALAQAGGGTLFVPAGKYFIGTPVIKDFAGSSGSVIIQGVPSLVMPAPPSANGHELAAGLSLQTDIIPATGNANSAFTIKNVKTFLIEHISFSGRQDQATDAFVTLNLSDIQDATIRHCEFYGVSSMGGGNVVRSVRSSISIELSVFLGCTANSGAYAPVVENIDWRGFKISNSIFLDYGLRPFFGKTGLGSPFSWINIARAADPTPEFPRREFIVRDLFLDEGGWIGITSTPHRWGIPLPLIDLVYITGLKMNVSNFNTFGHAFFDVRDVMIENSQYGWSLNASAAIELDRVENAIYDKLTCVADATRLHTDNLTQRLTVINSQYLQLDSEAQTTTVMQTAPEDDPVQFVRKRFSDVLGKAPDPAGHFYWSDLLIRCGEEHECLDQVRSQLSQYLASNPPSTFTLSGRVLAEGGQPLSGVLVQLSGSHNASMQSDSQGNFRFRSLPTSGSYTITVSKTHFGFAPPTQTVLNPVNDQNVVFNGSWNRHTIGGRIVTEAGKPLSGVTLSLDQPASTVTTDQDGRYSFSDLSEGNDYLVVPTKADFVFRPAYKSFGDLSSDQSADFVAISAVNYYKISGRIVTDAGQGLPGVTVKLGQSATVVTDGEGNYSFADLVERKDYTITPTLADFAFTPASHTFYNLSANQTANFVARSLFRTISGRIVTADGVGLPGINVVLGQSEQTVTTDSDGAFRFANLPDGNSYTVTPASLEFGFTPASRTFENLSADQTAEFVGKPLPKILTVADTDVALALESVMFMAQPFSLTTDLGFSLDRLTRIMVFATNLDVSNVSQVTATVEDESGRTYPVPIEYIGGVPGQGWLKQLNLELTHDIPSGAELKLRISTAEGSSNLTRLRTAR